MPLHCLAALRGNAKEHKLQRSVYGGVCRRLRCSSSMVTQQDSTLEKYPMVSLAGVRDVRGERRARRLPAEGGAEPGRGHARRLRLRRRGRHPPPHRVQKGQTGQNVSDKTQTCIVLQDLLK